MVTQMLSDYELISHMILLIEQEFTQNKDFKYI